MSTSIHSVLQETFTTFMTIAMGFMNQWHNAKFLMRTDHSRDCEAIVELVVNGFPVPPFEELLLHRLRKNGLVLLPFEERPTYPPVRFPFFFFVSSFIDDVVESAERELTVKGRVDDVGPADMLRVAQELVADSASVADNPGVESRRQLVLRILQIVACEKGERSTEWWDNRAGTSLFDDYLQQFVEWKVGCQSSMLMTNFFRDKITSFAVDEERSLLAIHVAARAHEVELSRAAAATVFVQRIVDAVPSTETMALDDENDIFDAIIHHFYELVCRDSGRWLESFWNCVLHAPFLCKGRRDFCRDTVAKVRVLFFLYILEVCKTDSSVKAKAKEAWLMEDKEKCLTMEYFVETVCIEGRGPRRASKEEIEMLQVFFSHPWLWLARDDIRDDISFLCSLIEGEDSGGCRRDFLACILEKALISSEDADAESSTVGLPMYAMEVIECQNRVHQIRRVRI